MIADPTLASIIAAEPSLFVTQEAVERLPKDVAWKLEYDPDSQPRWLVFVYDDPPRKGKGATPNLAAIDAALVSEVTDGR